MTTHPATPEGSLLREVRLNAGRTVKQAAAAIGMSLKQWGEAERGISGGREFRPPARTLAFMAGSLGITPEQLTAAGRADAAEILGTMPGPVPAAPAAPAVDIDALMQALIEKHDGAERDTLEWLYRRQLDADGRLLPQHERVRMVLGYVNRHHSEESAEHVG